MGVRSLTKGPFVDWKLLKKVNKFNKSNKFKSIKTWSRRSTILPSFIDKTLMVHNGKNMIPVFISEQMVGHKLGEFSLTRTFKGHGTNKK